MGGTTARCTNSRCPHLAQPLNTYTILGGVPLKGSFKGFLKGVYKGSIVGFHGIGALINTNAILEVPYYD